MRIYKIIDITTQVIAMAVIILAFAFGFVVFIYIGLLGLIQIISMLIHLAIKEEWKSKLRKIYHWALLLPVAGFIYAFTKESDDMYNMPALMAMLFVLIVSLLLAVFYLTISIMEWKKMKKLI